MRPTFRFSSFVILLSVASAPAVASAAARTTQTLARPALPDPATTDDATQRMVDWNRAYGEARVAMLAGQFEEATTKFALLVASAPDFPSRTLAAEMLSLCETWARGGLSLAKLQLGAGSVPTVQGDRRTTDEIAVLYTNAVFYGIYAGIVTFVLLKIIDKIVGVRVEVADEREGLDTSQHGEEGYAG